MDDRRWHAEYAAVPGLHEELAAAWHPRSPSTGIRPKDGSHRANRRDLTLPDGKKLFMGSSGTGAPTDGKDPTER
jgi:hypothetical protein